MNKSQPIGIFDSGIGGLTVVKAVVEQLPGESIIYFGDTAHLPYGDKSAPVIQGYACKIVDFLLSHNCKLILIACNSASAAAYDLLKEYIGDRALLLNVVDPVVQSLQANYVGKTVGLIGTKLTVQSQIYQKKLAKLHAPVTLHAVATSLLVPIIEEGLFTHNLIDVALQYYLTQEILQDIDALVLGCTHYPVIKDRIAKFYKNQIEIIDAPKIVAQAVKESLAARGWLRNDSNIVRHFYVSDLTPAFAKIAKMFFPEAVELKCIEL